ncbi:MAG: UvrD-helicase domain-containing protein, partial [Desulfuromonadales bacterium]|nr:UvrD-helicase domain-containing protein [Desulfuromonadales bacterium]
MSRPIADAGQRQAALDPRESFIVQAPAGSGKTELLIQRFLALLAVVERPEAILAITFTRKAAAEMRSRLLEALAAAQGACPEKPHAARTWELARGALANDRRLGWNLAGNPGRLTIQTIDSFNASLVRRMPWLSRLGGMPQVTDDPGALYRRAAERALQGLGRQGEEGEGISCLLSHLDNRLDHLRDLLVAMLARRDQWGRHLLGRRGEEQRASLECALRALVEAELKAACAVIPEAVRIDLAELAPFAAQNLVAEGKDGHLARLLDLDRFPVASADDLAVWRGMAELLLTGEGTLRKAVNKSCGFPADKVEPCLSMKRRMVEVLDWLKTQEGAGAALCRVRQLPPVVYETEQWQVLRALAELLPRAVAELWLVFREEGAADFAEIALKAQLALADEEGPSELLLRLDNRLDHILVDEFQDTSHLQFTLLQILTAGWQPGDGRTLFLVGDPMQSIYRFREAEVGLFLQARRRGLGSFPLRSLQLSANFRSQAGVVDWVNRSFAALFPPAEDAVCGAVPLAPAEAVHPPLPQPAVSIHPFAGRDDAGEAEQVVELVGAALARPGETVAILVRSRPHLARLLPALRAAGFPYQAQEIDLLAERPAGRDLASLTRALLHPADRLAWLAVLRAPWCVLTLTDLHALVGGQRHALLPELLADPTALARLSADGRGRAERTGRILAEAAARRGRVGLRPLVEGCWLALGGPAFLDAAALDDASRVLELLESLDQGGDLADFEALERG